MAYNTGNPSGSSDPRDLSDSSADIDTWATSTTVDTHPDRLGTVRKTWHGMENEFDADQVARASEFDADQADRAQRFDLFLANSGYQFVGDYAAGIELTEYNQVVRDVSGNLWRVSASTSLPYTTTGAGLPEGGAFIAIGDADLAQNLISDPSTGRGALLVRGAVIYVDKIADLRALPTSELVDGQQVSVLSYHAPLFPSVKFEGGGEFYWDAASTDADNGGTVLAPSYVATGRFKRRLSDGVVTSEQWGIPGSLPPADLAQQMQAMWDWCATNGIKAVMMPGEHVVDRYDGRPEASSALVFPSNLNIHFENGFFLTKVDFVEAVVEPFYRVLSITTNAHDVVATGRLEIDGKGDSVTWYNEHNHCMFIYKCRDIDMSGLSIVAYNAMGDCVSLSGANNTEAGLTKRVRIGSITCTQLNSLGRTARRKSLVIEATQDCYIGVAVLDNGAANCLDYEPFSVQDDAEVMSCKIDYLKCFSGTDYTSGTPETLQRVAKLYIDSFNITIPDRDATLQPANDIIKSFGVACHINSLSIDYKKCRNSVTGMNLQFPGCRWSISDLFITTSDYEHGGPAISVVASVSGGASGPAELNANTIKVRGKGNKSFDVRGVLIANNIHVEGVLESGLRADFGDTFFGGQFNQDKTHYLSVGSLLFKNVNKSTGGIVDPIEYLGRTPVLWSIRQITYMDSSLSAPINALIYVGPPSTQEHVHIGAIKLVGQPPAALVATRSGIPGFWVTRGGYGAPSEYYSTHSDPNVIPAVRGSTVICGGNGTIWVKTTDDDGAGDRTSGWLQMATVA